MTSGEHELRGSRCRSAPKTSGTDSCRRRTACPVSCTACVRTGRTIRCTACVTTRNKLLLDPYARALAGRFEWNPALLGSSHGRAGRASAEPTDSAPYNYKARVIDGAFDWGDDRPPAMPWRDTVIYEAHVKGFTKLHPQVPERERGTYLGLAHPEVIGI